MIAAIDITAAQRKTLLAILRRYIPGVLVWAYGSRVKFTARPNSDLDLVAFTTPTQKRAVSDLKDDLAESNLPFLVDLHDWDEVPEKFHEIIRKEYVVLQEVPEKVERLHSSGWEDLTLGDLGSVLTGKTPLTAVEGNFGGQIPFVTPSDMDGRKTISTTARYLTEAGAASVKGSVIPAGAIMVSCIGSDMGKVVIAGRECVTNQQINSIVVDDRFSSELVYYSLSTRKNEIRHQAAGGSAVPILNKSDFSRMEITLPPLAEQKAIAAVLGALDDKIELNRRMNATLEAIARTLFQSWFVDFDPVRANLDLPAQSAQAGGRPPEGLDPATAALFPDSFQESSLGPIPKGWEVKTVNEVSTVGIGKTPPRMELHWFSENPADVPWMSIRDLGVAGVFISHTSEFLTAEAVEKFRVKRIPDNTVVLSFKLTMGRVAITDGEMLSNEAIAHFRLNPDTTFGSAYLYCYLKGFSYEQLGSTSSIATAINSDMVRGMRVLVPPKGIVEAFERTVKPLFTQMKNIQNQSRTLATLRDTLLPKLLSGELSVAADSVIRESRITAADGPGQSAAARTRRKTAR